MLIQDNIILITGGGRGIGNFLAMHLALVAKKVIVFDKSPELIDQLHDIPNIEGICCDITDPEAVRDSVAEIFQKGYMVDVCINNAGIIHSEPLINLLSKQDRRHSIDNWKRVMDVNLNAVFYVTSSVADAMISARRKGVIINISSIAAQGNIGQSAYAASKAAVEALTKTWSKELSIFGIRAGCIAPGFFDTPSTREGLNIHMLEKWEKMVPLRRLGNLNELLSSVKFIIENDYFNGKILSVDGGLNI